MPYETYYSARDTILEFITKDAFGPIEREEVLQEPPLDTYVCGILWPKGTSSNPTGALPSGQMDDVEESPDNDFGTDIEDELDDSIRGANQFRPSVMAISFALPNSQHEVNVQFECATYENIDKPVEGKNYVLHEYRRSPLSTETMTVPLPRHNKKIPLFRNRAILQIVRRREVSEGGSLWTISVENTKCASQNEIEQNISALFQCALTVRGQFVSIVNPAITSGDKDRQKMDFLYRNVQSYAAGHGCSVRWDEKADSVTELHTTFIPTTIISQMIAVTDKSLSCFKMHAWTDEHRNTVLAELTSYIDSYSAWKSQLQNQLVFVPESYKTTATTILENISSCIERLSAGIVVLGRNDTAWKAFCLMNKAMMRQSTKKRNQPEDEVSWYPFQLCYLGSADTLIIDRVCSYAESLRRHKLNSYAEEVDMPHISNEYEYGELTSRKSAREITEVRNQLDRQHYPSAAALNYVLSSNMLSVGIDINRLGLMTVYGQPKATAEYIQATSRVGRSNPGLVVVLLHMLRTRDKSHFEQFQTYHQALNKMVEPTSATPYACRTMDKALHSVFVALVRHLCPELSRNANADKFRKNAVAIQQLRNDLIHMIGQRSEETVDYAEAILDDFIEQWHEAAVTRRGHFQYQLLNKSENDTDALLIPAERSENAVFPPTMNSMRNVDTQSGVFLKRRQPS